MSQMCTAPCCQNRRREAAVYAMNNPDISRSPPTNSANNFAGVLQAQLVNWRPIVYNSGQQNFIPTYAALRQSTMATQQPPIEGDSWALLPNDQDKKLQVVPQRFFGVPQENTFFAEQMDYRAEQSILFNPLRQFTQQAAPHTMDTLTKPFDPSEARVGGSNSFPSIDKSDESAAVPQIQTNVDTNQFQLVRSEDWRTASIAGFGTDEEDDAVSPASTEATSHGPFTPVGFDGDSGFPDDAIRRFSQELSTSFESAGSDMFKADFDFSSRDFSGARQVTVVPRRTGIQHDNYINSGYGGLPFPSSNTYGYSESYNSYSSSGSGSDTTGMAMATARNSNQKMMQQASFRDADGFPANPTFALPTRDQRASIGTTSSSTHNAASSQTETQSDEESDPEAAHRRRRDRYLLDQREKGLTYREIKRRGKFTEAESTLRGRVRQLTKDKSERVRKPTWTDKDVRLLRTAVAYHRKLREEGAYIRHRDGKLPWKQIAERMRDEGASYMFAPATCAKKYEDIGGR